MGDACGQEGIVVVVPGDQDRGLGSCGCGDVNPSPFSLERAQGYLAACRDVGSGRNGGDKSPTSVVCTQAGGSGAAKSLQGRTCRISKTGTRNLPGLLKRAQEALGGRGVAEAFAEGGGWNAINQPGCD